MIAAGADAGSFADVRDPDNPDGYAEHPAVRVFNDRLLAHLGASWDNWGFRAGQVDWEAPALAPWRDEAVALLRAAFPGDGPFVLKDPRCATLARSGRGSSRRPGSRCAASSSCATPPRWAKASASASPAARTNSR